MGRSVGIAGVSEELGGQVSAPAYAFVWLSVCWHRLGDFAGSLGGFSSFCFEP